MSGSDDNTIRIWDLETGEAFGAPLRGHTGSVQSIAISSDGSHIVSGSYDQTIRVWDAETGEVLGSPLQGHTSSVMSVAISPDGNRIVSGSDDKTIRVWDAETSTAEALGGALQGHTDSVNSVAISPDGHHIVSGSSDKTVWMWDMETGKALGASLQGHTQSVQAVSISSDGHRVVSGSNHGTIRVWNVETGQASGVPLQDGMGFSCVTISLDGRCVATADPFESRIGVWDTETCKASGHPLQANNGSWDYIQSVAISPDAKRIVSGSSDHTVQVWDLQTGKGLGAPLRGHTDEVCALSISPDGKYIMSGSRDKTIRVWDMETRKTLSTLLQGHTGPVRTVAMSPDGKHIVSGSDDRTVRVWDMETGESLASLLGHTGTVRTIAISPDSKHIVSGSHDTTIRVWNLEFLTQHRPIEAPAICFSPNPTHALHSPSSFLQDSSASASLATNEEGWVSLDGYSYNPWNHWTLDFLNIGILLVLIFWPTSSSRSHTKDSQQRARTALQPLQTFVKHASTDGSASNIAIVLSMLLRDISNGVIELRDPVSDLEDLIDQGVSSPRLQYNSRIHVPLQPQLLPQHNADVLYDPLLTPSSSSPPFRCPSNSKRHSKFSNCRPSRRHTLTLAALAYDPMARKQCVDELGIKGWRKRRLMLKFEAALVRRGWLERWNAVLEAR
ncbi:quinon protein alcohol dehydrogenase-like superfamily [Suillus ampliporus]|nr:quinon protein alcohol dehydrogenase-like superfamily [Suillus ampliporus]